MQVGVFRDRPAMNVHVCAISLVYDVDAPTHPHRAPRSLPQGAQWRKSAERLVPACTITHHDVAERDLTLSH